MTPEEAKKFIAQSVKSDVDMALVADAIKSLGQEQSTIAELEKIKAEIAESFSSSVADCIYIIDNRISYLKGDKCDNDHDCEHCDWVECPEMKGDNNG